MIQTSYSLRRTGLFSGSVGEVGGSASLAGLWLTSILISGLAAAVAGESVTIITGLYHLSGCKRFEFLGHRRTLRERGLYKIIPRVSSGLKKPFPPSYCLLYNTRGRRRAAVCSSQTVAPAPKALASLLLASFLYHFSHYSSVISDPCKLLIFVP